MPWFEEAFKAVLTALAAAAVAQTTSLFETLTDPNSPKKVLDEGQKTITLVDSWAKASEQLQRLPASAVKDAAQERLDEMIRTLSERQLRYSRIRDEQRNQLLHFLAHVRLVRPEGWVKGLSAFLCYLFVILFLQSIHIYVRGDIEFNWRVIPLFAALAGFFWLLSSPNKRIRDN
jgi:hypothetical protein